MRVAAPRSYRTAHAQLTAFAAGLRGLRALRRLGLGLAVLPEWLQADMLEACLELPVLQSLCLESYGEWNHGLCMRVLPRLRLHQLHVGVGSDDEAERVVELVGQMQDLRAASVHVWQELGRRGQHGAAAGACCRSWVTGIPRRMSCR